MQGKIVPSKGVVFFALNFFYIIYFFLLFKGQFRDLKTFLIPSYEVKASITDPWFMGGSVKLINFSFSSFSWVFGDLTTMGNCKNLNLHIIDFLPNFSDIPEIFDKSSIFPIILNILISINNDEEVSKNLEI